YKIATNIRRTDTLKYKLSSIVILNIENYATGRLIAKLSLRFKGPFRVIKADSHSLELSLLTNIKVIYIINILRVKPYKEGL
ncbi:hypothetical protein NEUTE2DRAFT_44614, partial [Neurospora tetrasperma FGSC 2509]